MRSLVIVVILNSGKTNYISFHSVRKKASSNAILINNKPLMQLESTKFLGVIIDSHLSWKDHITLITNKISKNLGIISRIKHCLPFHVLLNLYYTLIFPYLSYCNIVWGSNPRQQKFRAMNGAHLASPIRGELGYAHWPQLGTQFIALLGTKFGAH